MAIDVKLTFFLIVNRFNLEVSNNNFILKFQFVNYYYLNFIRLITLQLIIQRFLHQTLPHKKIDELIIFTYQFSILNYNK